MRLAGHLLLLAAFALLGIKAAFDDHESCVLLAGLGVFLYGLLCATYLVMSCSGWLLTVHALAADAPPAQNAGSKRRRHPSENAGPLDHRSGHVAAPLAGLYP
jgi:hypothetical protein